MIEKISIETPQDLSKELDELIELLPPLKEGWIRLTHFTTAAIAQKLNDGENFEYEVQGLLGQTTDAFSVESLESLKILVETGKTGAFCRSEFGNYVVLIDLLGRENRLRNSFTVNHSTVPNENILGYIKIDETHEGKSYSFFSNLKYKPVVNELGAIKRSVRRELHVSQKKEPQIDAPKKKEKPSVDVW